MSLFTLHPIDIHTRPAADAAERPADVLHIASKDFRDGAPFEGEYRDIAAVEDLLAAHANIDRICIRKSRFRGIFGVLDLMFRKNFDIGKYDLVFASDGSLPVLLIVFLRLMKRRDAKFVYRAHEADVPFGAQKFLLAVLGFRVRTLWKMLALAVRTAGKNYLLLRAVDFVLPASRFDAEHYWRGRVGKKVLYLPYMPTEFPRDASAGESGDNLVLLASEHNRNILDDHKEIFADRKGGSSELPESVKFVRFGDRKPPSGIPAHEIYAAADAVGDYMSKARLICHLVKGEGEFRIKAALADGVASGVPHIVRSSLYETLDGELAHGTIPFGKWAPLENFRMALDYALDDEGAISLTDAGGENIGALMHARAHAVIDYLLDSSENDAPQDRFCLLTVLDRLDERFVRNVKTVSEKNPTTRVDWVIITNMIDKDAAAVGRELSALEDGLSNIRFVIRQGQANTIRGTENTGSLNHSVGLHHGLTWIADNHENYDYVVILDPDFYIVEDDWLHKTRDRLIADDLDIYGSEADPAALSHHWGLPTPHFMFMRHDRRLLLSLDFTPDFIRAIRDKEIFSALQLLGSYDPPDAGFLRKVVSMPFKLINLWRSAHKRMGTNGDTGCRIALDKSLKVKTLQMVVPPLRLPRIFRSPIVKMTMRPKLRNLVRYIEDGYRIRGRLELDALCEAGEVHVIPDDFMPTLFAVHLHSSVSYKFPRPLSEFAELMQGKDAMDDAPAPKKGAAKKKPAAAPAAE